MSCNSMNVSVIWCLYFFKVTNQLFTCQVGFTYYSYKPFYLRDSDADCLTGKPHWTFYKPGRFLKFNYYLFLGLSQYQSQCNTNPSGRVSWKI